MNLRQIELFVAIAETGSFSRAAESARLNQSTISQHIAALEEEIGSILLDRTAKGATLTDGGKVFLRHARRILAERDALQQAMSRYSGLEDAQLRIGASNIPANYMIPQLLTELAARHPGIVLTMKTGDSREIIDSLVASEIELALVGSRFENKEVNYTPFASDTLVLIVGPDHRWRERGTISLEELSVEPLVIRESGSGSGHSLAQSLREAGINPEKLRIAARLGSNEAVLQAVASDFGCAFVSELAIRNRLARQEIFRVEVSGFTVERQIWLATLRDRSLSPAATVFSQILSDCCT